MQAKLTSMLTSVALTIALLIQIPVFAAPTPVTDNTSDGYDSTSVTKILEKTSISTLKAKAAVLIDATSGNVLFEKNSTEKLPIASVTKIMSMLMVMEAIDSGKLSFDDKVPVSEHSYNMGGSQVYLKPGEEFTVREMLKAVAVHSANDATVALAEKVAGSEDTFVSSMNERAKALGMNDSNFLDCTGLTDEGHYSSAKDVAIMSRELITKHPKIFEFTTIWTDKFRDGTFDLSNTNKLIRFYQGANGLKTGFTTKAGYCLSGAAKRNNLQLISVVLGEPDTNTRFAETRKLLDYGFANYELTKLESKGTPVGETDVKKGVSTKVKGIFSDDVNLLLNKGQKGKISKSIKLESLSAPVKAGTKIGEAVFTLDGKEVGKADIVAQATVEKASFIRLFFRMVLAWLGFGK